MPRLTFSLLLVILALLPTGGQARPLAAAPQNVLLSSNRTEPVIAIDAAHPGTVVAAANTNYSAPVGGTLPTAYFSSQNGGRSFLAGTAPMIQPYTVGADPSMTVAQDGTVFYSYLGETPNLCTGGRAAVVLTHSIDHGRSYRAPVIVDGDPADDKPFLAVESIPGQPSHLFVTWTRWHAHSSDIWVTRSTDGGVHFSRPQMLLSSSQDNFGPIPIVGPRGRVYVFWAIFPDTALTKVAPTRIVMRASTDDGVHFGPVQRVAGSFGGVPRMAAPGFLRNFTLPAPVVDGKGNLYVAWSQVSRAHGDGSVDANIEISRSVNGGRSWSSPARVNDAGQGDRFMPALSLWKDGSLGLAFYDRRNGGSRLDLYAVRVTFNRGFRAGRNLRVNKGTAPISDIYYMAPGSTCFSPGRFFGDYIGVAAAPGGALDVVWADTQLHAQNETDIWFARAHPPR